MSDKEDSDSLFEELYRRYYGAVFSVFVRRGFSRDEARDLAQTTFVRVYQGMESYRGDAEWAYLLETATRVGLNELRYRQAGKRNVETTSFDTMDHLQAHLNPTTGRPPASPLEEILRREETCQMREVIEEISPEDRRYLKMWLQGRRYSEIATAMQVSMDSVKSRLYRTKKHLAERLREKLDGSDLDWLKKMGAGK